MTALNTYSPWLAAAMFLGYAAFVCINDGRRMANGWMFPASLSLLFLTFSLAAVIIEGPLGFWSEHTRNLWGNQIWFDLLFAIGIGWTFLVPAARALGMRPMVWLLLVLATGCIGLLAMTSRVLYLRERQSSMAGAAGLGA